MTRPLGNVKQLVFSGAGEKIVTVGKGKRCSLLVDNPNGNTFDVVGYTMSAAEATARGLTRTKFVLEAGVTSLTYSKTPTGPVEEIGFDVTAYVGVMNADIVLASQAVS